MNIPYKYYLLVCISNLLIYSNINSIEYDFVITSFIYQMILFYSLIIPLTFIDYFKITPLYKYKVEKNKNILTPTLLFNTFKLVLFNQLLLPIISYVLYPLIKINDISSPLSVYSLDELVYLIPFMIIEELGFYYTHLLLHFPFFYRHIHKIHHEWKYPIGLSCIYAHPIEFIISNIFPTILVLLLFSYLDIYISIYFYWLWMTIGFINTIYSHSGYSNSKKYQPHFYHHMSFNYNYGVFMIIDKLMGTYKNVDRWDIKCLF